MRTKIALVAAILASLTSEVFALDAPNIINWHQGMKLVVIALGEASTWPDHTGLDYEGKDSRMGRPFLAYSRYNEIYGHSMGAYAVNPWTGDVWDLWRCKPLDNPALEKSKLNIRKRFHYSDDEYAVLTQKQPLCLEEPGVIQ